MVKTASSSSETSSSSYWERLRASSAWHPFQTHISKKANGNSLRISTSEDWSWLLLYPETAKRDVRRLGVLARFITPTGQATWDTIKTEADAGRVALPAGARFSQLTDRGLPRWNIVVTRDLPMDGSLAEDQQFAWLVEQATALAAVIEPMVGRSCGGRM